jgi:hypothetical protein
MAPLRPVDPDRGCAVDRGDGRHYARSLRKRHARRAYAYGLKVEELIALLDAAPACACCDRLWGTSRGRQAVIDHDHATGKIQGSSAAPATSASATSTTTRIASSAQRPTYAASRGRNRNPQPVWSPGTPCCPALGTSPTWSA